MKAKLKTTLAHKAFGTALYDREMRTVIAYGSAGTGKTYGAIKAALTQLMEGKIKQIIVCRPNVSFADGNGYLPGSEREKMEPWVRPILQNARKLGYGENQLRELENSGKLVFYPLEFIQGLTFDNAFIIVDECQNMSFPQLKVFLGRTGEYSRVVLCGDVAQISPKFHQSGLASLLSMIDQLELPVHTINFTREDIVRSHEAKMWIEAFETWEAK